MNSSEPLLRIQDLTVRFAGLKAISELSLAVGEGLIFGLIGPNGAGKTTVFNVVTGLIRPALGSVRFLGHDITDLKPYQICRRGVARTFQNIRLFKELTVEDNVQIGLDAAPSLEHPGTVQSIFRSASFREREARMKAMRQKLLEQLALWSRRDELAKNLPYGDQRRLEIARAVATGAKLILLDEPAAGMNRRESEWLAALIRSLQREMGLTVFLIEHDMRLVMTVCDRIAVMDYGQKIAEGSAAEIQQDPKVIEAYLGGEAK